jgi:hypothetical protein
MGRFRVSVRSGGLLIEEGVSKMEYPAGEGRRKEAEGRNMESPKGKKASALLFPDPRNQGEVMLLRASGVTAMRSGILANAAGKVSGVPRGEGGITVMGFRSGEIFTVEAEKDADDSLFNYKEEGRKK